MQATRRDLRQLSGSTPVRRLVVIRIAVVLAVVVQRQLDLFPAHVRHRDVRAVFVVDGQLGLRSREAVADDE